MNLREKFIWNMVIAIAIIVFLLKAWTQFNNHTMIKNEYNKFKNEKVGTDEELTNMVTELETNLNFRQNFDFKPKNNPLNLANVLSFDGNSGKTKKGVVCNSFISNPDGSFKAECSYKGENAKEFFKGEYVGPWKIVEIYNRGCELHQYDEYGNVTDSLKFEL